MRTLLAVILALVPAVHGQDARLLKAVEPEYGKYSPELATEFDVANASVTVSVMANGKPFSLDRASVPLPTAVVMALKEYEFRPADVVPHGRTDIEVGVYEVTLNVPIRKSKDAERNNESAIWIGPGIAKGLIIRQVRPELSEFARHNRIQGLITLEARITKEGSVEILKVGNGPFALIDAAYDAVKQWQYRPYLLNREPREVLTNIEIMFN